MRTLSEREAHSRNREVSKTTTPNAECVSCGMPLTVPAHLLETEEGGFNCAGCYFVGAPR